MGICSWCVVIASAQDLTASCEALSHAASATLTAINTHAASSRCTQKACNKIFHTTKAFTLCIANGELLTRNISNAIAMCSNGQQHHQGAVLRASQQHSQLHSSKRSTAKQMVQHITHSQPNAQPKCTQPHYTPTTVEVDSHTVH